MEVNDDEMIVVVVGDDDVDTDGTNEYETSESPEPEMPVTAKIEPIENYRDYSTEEDEQEIYKLEEYIKVKPEIEIIEEEYLSEEFSQDDSETKDIETYASERKRTPRKTTHEYLVDEKDILPPKSKKRKRNTPQKLKPKPKRSLKNMQNIKTKTEPISISDEDDFFEIEYLEDDVLVSPKNTLEENFTEIEMINNPPKKNRNKTISLKKVIVKTEDDIVDSIEDDNIENYIKIEKELDKNRVSKNNDAINTEDEYIPEEEEEDEDFIGDDYLPPNGRKKKAKNPSRRPSRRPLKHTKIPVRPMRSFIAQLKKDQPVYKQDTEKLVNYLVEYMRKRRPPSPPPNYCFLSDVDRYSCSLCNIVKPTEPAASRHYQAAHGPRYLVCLACGSGFRSTVILYKHEKICSARDAEIQLRARGIFLGRKGRGRPYLTKNKFIPKEPPPDQPPKRIHIPHSQKKKYYCEKCPSYFTREYLLEEHMHKHTGYRAFQCPDCPAAYVSRYQLNKHSKKHSNCEYICDHCGKVFKLKTTLTSHLDTHLPRPRFGCGRCGRRYSKRAAVRIHIMRDHMQLPPPAVCPLCPKRYNLMGHVKVHMKRDHGLTLMTKRSIDRELPYMKVEDLEGAKVVFNNDDGIELVDINATLNEQILP